MVWPQPHVGRRTVAILLSSFARKNTAKYIFSRWTVPWRGCWPPCREPITEGPIGREMENGSISTPTDLFAHCGQSEEPNSACVLVQPEMEKRRSPLVS